MALQVIYKSSEVISTRVVSHLVHSWVTDLSLTAKALQPRTTLKQHPGAATPVAMPKQRHRRSHAASNLGVTPAISKSVHCKPAGRTAAGSSTPTKLSARVVMSANSPLFVSGVASPLVGCMCSEAAAQQAASLFSVESVQAVLAVGTSGPVFNAKYRHNAYTFSHKHALLCLLQCLSCRRSTHGIST